MVDLSVNLAGLDLINPIIPASGTFGFGQEFRKFYDLNKLGGISIKGTTREARFGNPTPRIAECPNGMLNAVGLQNPGVHKVLDEEIPNLRSFYKNCIVANISGFSIDDYAYCCELMGACEDVDIIEVNVSCPNVKHGGMSFGTSPEQAGFVTKAVKEVSGSKPVFIKLSPNVTDIVSIALACQEAGADGLCLINTLLGMRINLKRREAILANTFGGFSGPAIFPVALRMVYQVAQVVQIPIMACGGVTSARDVLEMMLAGASAVQIGSANLIDPYACSKVIDELPQQMKELGITSLSELIGEANGTFALKKIEP